jgi:hypothetical protein
MEYKLVKLSNKAKYILANLDGSVDLRRKTRDQVDTLLTEKGFQKLDGDYKYLTKMAMDSVCQENVDAALKEKGDTEQELMALKDTSCEQMWLKELDVFEREYMKYRETRNKQNSSVGSEKPKKLTKKPQVK